MEIRPNYTTQNSTENNRWDWTGLECLHPSTPLFTSLAGEEVTMRRVNLRGFPWHSQHIWARPSATRPSAMGRHQERNFHRYGMPASTGSGVAKRTAYVAFGSNLGDRIGWIERACREMDARSIRVRRTSSLWETDPMYVLDQDRFVNGACEVGESTRVTPSSTYLC